jgi:hypothetical protein
MTMAAKIVGFDYNALDAQHRKTTQEDARAIRGLLERSGAAVVEIGKRLCAVHERIGRNDFQKWLKAEFRWSQSVASNYMQAARAFGEVDCLQQFQPSALFELSRRQVPPEALARSVAEAKNGETVTRRRAQEIIASVQTPGTETPLSRDAIRRVRSSLNMMADHIETLVAALAPEDLDGLVDQLFDMAARLRAARAPKGADRRPSRPAKSRRPELAIA